MTSRNCVALNTNGGQFRVVYGYFNRSNHEVFLSCTKCCCS